jgi:hypothetical protein
LWLLLILLLLIVLAPETEAGGGDWGSAVVSADQREPSQ